MTAGLTQAAEAFFAALLEGRVHLEAQPAFELSPGQPTSYQVTVDPAPPVDEPADMSEVSDGSHTFGELYEFRMLYHAAAVRGWDLRNGHWVVKSWRHSDGELCFGGGWFVVVAHLPGVGQVSNHYPAEDWDLFVCQETENAPPYDGHTTQDVADRLRRYLEGGNS